MGIQAAPVQGISMGFDEVHRLFVISVVAPLAGGKRQLLQVRLPPEDAKRMAEGMLELYEKHKGDFEKKIIVAPQGRLPS